MKQLGYLLFIFVFLACGEQEIDTIIDATNLAEFVDEAEERLVRDSLIACALGGQGTFLSNDDATLPVSILFYPEGNATDFKYFETATIEVNPDDLTNYEQKELPHTPIFNGYLRRFERAAIDQNIWCRVTFIRDGNLHISNAIRIKYSDIPTEHNTSLLAIDQAEPGSPNFTWEDGIIPENVIYFHALLDADGELVSGTYTFDRQFQFYNLSNVVLNIRDVTPAPSLIPNDDYQLVIMGVSLDNWVNLLLDVSFQAKE